MNLKEAFRYQSYLDRLIDAAVISIGIREHALTTTKTHNKNKANSDAENLVETVEVEDFIPNDTVIRLMQWLIEEKETLTTAINAAKASIGIDIDAAIESNKYRQKTHMALTRMMTRKPTKKTERGQDYKFNAEGNQMPYYYDIEVTETEAYDRAAAKAFDKAVIAEADKVSAAIDAAMVNTEVAYEPKFDVNETFDDVAAEFSIKA